jgi:hypothetical protein
MMKYTYIFLIIFLFFSAAANSATICDIDADGDVDKFDIENITAARGSKSTGVGDSRDVDGDGLITVGDGRLCVLKCTLPKCAEPTKMVVVPDVVGMMKSLAKDTILTAQLTLGTVVEENNTSIPAGNVIRQQPLAGTNLTANSAVNLVISKGPFLIVVPDVVGLSEATAKTMLGVLGLVLGDINTANSNSFPAGSVISQTPVAGSSVSNAIKIDLVISEGVASVEIGRDVIYEGPKPIDPAVLASLPIDVPTGKPVAIEISDVKIVFDENVHDAIRGFGECKIWIATCINENENRSLDDCSRSVPQCTTSEPWNEAKICCPTECFERYKENRKILSPIETFEKVYLEDASCYPGYNQLLKK